MARWTNEVTLRSLERYAEYEPGSYIERVAPTPLLVICMREDTVTPTDEILGAYGRAREPKRLLLLDGGHYDVYGTGTGDGRRRSRGVVHRAPRQRVADSSSDGASTESADPVTRTPTSRP